MGLRLNHRRGGLRVVDFFDYRGGITNGANFRFRIVHRGSPLFVIFRLRYSGGTEGHTWFWPTRLRGRSHTAMAKKGVLGPR